MHVPRWPETLTGPIVRRSCMYYWSDIITLVVSLYKIVSEGPDRKKLVSVPQNLDYLTSGLSINFPLTYSFWNGEIQIKS